MIRAHSRPLALASVLALLAGACAGGTSPSPSATGAASPTTGAASPTSGPASPTAGAASPTAGGESPAATGTAAAPSGEPIKIGGSLGLTGVFSGPSAGYKATYDYWVEQVNSSGGLLGRPVEVTIYDDESTAATAQTLYQRLINEDRVDLLLAPYTTAVSSAVVPLASQNEKVIWNGGFINEAILRSNPWVITSYTRMEKDTTRPVYELIDQLPEGERPTKVGIITEQNPFALAVRDGYEGDGGARKYAQDRGMEIVLDEEYAPTTTDFSPLIQRAREAGVEVFFALALPNPAGLIAQAVDSGGFQPTIYCSCASEVTSLPNWGDLGPAANGIMAVTAAWPSDGYPGLQELADHLEQAQGYPHIPNYAVVGMAALQVMQQAVEGVGSIDDQAALRDYVRGKTFETVEGPITFTEGNIPDFSTLLLQWQDDENVAIWPEDRATGDPVIPMP